MPAEAMKPTILQYLIYWTKSSMGDDDNTYKIPKVCNEPVLVRADRPLSVFGASRMCSKAALALASVS